MIKQIKERIKHVGRIELARELLMMSNNEKLTSASSTVGVPTSPGC
jgi:hypothetical protein